MKSSDPANIKISFFFMELSSFLWGFSFAWCPKGMRLLLLPPFAFVCVCQDPLIALDSLSLKQFGEKDGGHRDPELREGVRDEGQARSIQLPLLLLSLCCTSSWQQLGLAHPEHSASWSYFPSLTHLRQWDRHSDGAQLEGGQPLHEATEIGVVRKCRSRVGEDAGRRGVWGCGYTVVVQTPLTLLFKKQLATPLISQGFTSEGKRKAYVGCYIY